MSRSTARLAAAAIAVLAITLTGCAGNGGDTDGDERSLTIATPSDPFRQGLNPQGNHEGVAAVQLLFDTVLFKANDPARTSVEDWNPALATEWTLSEDRREATFTIREDAVFSDGMPVNAEVI